MGDGVVVHEALPTGYPAARRTGDLACGATTMRGAHTALRSPVPRVGIKPATTSVVRGSGRRNRSNNKKTALWCGFRSPLPDSNRRPLPYHQRARHSGLLPIVAIPLETARSESPSSRAGCQALRSGASSLLPCRASRRCPTGGVACRWNGPSMTHISVRVSWRRRLRAPLCVVEVQVPDSRSVVESACTPSD
jgi:hypothetical protein